MPGVPRLSYPRMWRLRMFVASALVVLPVAGALGPRIAQAQPAGDWGVKRDPFNPTDIARYKAILVGSTAHAGARSPLLKGGSVLTPRTFKTLVAVFATLQREPLGRSTYLAGLFVHAKPEVAAVLSRGEIDRLCSLDIHFAHVDATFRKLGLA